MRRLLYIVEGRASAKDWVQAASEEAPISGKPKACSGCPLRIGGEWEEGVCAAFDGKPMGFVSERWGCHESARPCAGMRRLAKAQSAGES